MFLADAIRGRFGQICGMRYRQKTLLFYFKRTNASGRCRDLDGHSQTRVSSLTQYVRVVAGAYREDVPTSHLK